MAPIKPELLPRPRHPVSHQRARPLEQGRPHPLHLTRKHLPTDPVNRPPRRPSPNLAPLKQHPSPPKHEGNLQSGAEKTVNNLVE